MTDWPDRRLACRGEEGELGDASRDDAEEKPAGLSGEASFEFSPCSVEFSWYRASLLAVLMLGTRSLLMCGEGGSGEGEGEGDLAVSCGSSALSLCVMTMSGADGTGTMLCPDSG